MSPKRGTFSVTGRTYDRLLAYCLVQCIPMGVMVEKLVNPVLSGAQPIPAEAAGPAVPALDREMRTVQVDGHEVHVKLAVHNGLVVNAQPEYDDVARAAAATGRPVKEVLADAIAASRGFVNER